jgi:membrane-bound lytic murein transglycosylase A
MVCAVVPARAALASAAAATWAALGLAACSTTMPQTAALGTAPAVSASASVRFEREAVAPGADADDPATGPLLTDGDWLAAWPAWIASCRALAAARNLHSAAWQSVCASAVRLAPRSGAQVRDYFTSCMDLYRVIAVEAPPPERTTGLFTGYYEPQIEGSRVRDGQYAVPLYRAPAAIPAAPRADLERAGALRGQELIWVHDPLDAFMLEVQGSGRIHLADGTWLRLAYAANNGQPYRSIGRWLADLGELDAATLTMRAIRDWAQAHPERVREMLDQNPRVIFFREAPLGDPAAGPVGAQGVALTPGVSVAIDPQFIPMGAPLLLTTVSPVDGLTARRLAVAQDTGGAIRGPLRIDWFWGPGEDAGAIAGRLHAQGTVHVFVPRGLTPESLL